MDKLYKVLSAKKFFSDVFFPLSALRFVHNMPAGPVHSHEFFELVIIIDGNAIHKVNGIAYGIRRGDVFIVPEGLPHQYMNSKELHLINIIYDPGKLPVPVMDMQDFRFFDLLFHESSKLTAENSAVLLHLDEDKIRQISGLADMIAEQQNSWIPGSRFCSLAAFMQIAGLLSQWHHKTRHAQAPVYAVSRVLNYINRNYNKNIDPDKLAVIGRMSRRTLFRRFTAATGMTPGHYLLFVRIRRAAEMLRHTSAPVSEIALLCGFNDSNYFSKQFRRVMNMSPSACRLRFSGQASTGLFY
ncbi:MAG: helix-turn-helix domain-containing protein [Victivallales bacterium]|nr:helix-turn-helix domain-containing protein [Victivallales bacterium]